MQISTGTESYVFGAPDIQHQYRWFSALLAAGLASPETVPSEMVGEAQDPRMVVREALRAAFASEEDEPAAPASDDSCTSLPRPTDLATRGLPHPDADEVLALMLALEQEAQTSSDIHERLERIRAMWRTRAQIHLGATSPAAAARDGRHSLLVDVPALIEALRIAGSGIQLGEHTWLGMRFQNAFTGKQLVAWLQTNCGCSPDMAAKTAEGLRRLGFFHHSFRSFKFSPGCFFFWNEDRLAGLQLQLEYQWLH